MVQLRIQESKRIEEQRSPVQGKPLLDVLAGKKPDRRPIWFMRQAGRYLPEYRKLRQAAGSFLELCYTSKLAAEVTLQPIRRYDLDAAILFSDILVVPHAMGVALRFVEGEGPVLETVRSKESVRNLKPVHRSDQVRAVYETVARVHATAGGSIALIGFCGGPWTVASYMIEGGSSSRALAKATASGHEPWFIYLIDRLVEASIDYLSGQVEAGAGAVQIFDSWAGDLQDGLREDFIDKPLARLVRGFRELHPAIPVIVFARGVGFGHEAIQEMTKAEAVSIESELPIEWARDTFVGKCAVQGNLDPLLLLGPENAARQAATKLAEAMPADRHIFNLGHGIQPSTRPEMLSAVIDTVRSYDQAKASG
ncbi:MAG: uroporphyrinogen decarboxylase [Aestuariivirga sp.]